MNLDRRGFLAFAGLVASAIGISRKAKAAGESSKLRGRTYVAACPPVRASIPRTPGPPRIMVIGGHPDDADIICGCTAAKLIAKGCRVKFVAACNGDIGHHRLSRAETAAVRRQETLNAAKVWGLDSYDIYGFGDARCPNTIEAREMVARKIQEFEPDIIMTHRDCDYHVDHRTIGTLVKDCGYMLGCPHWIEGSKALRRRPLILLMSQNAIASIGVVGALAIIRLRGAVKEPMDQVFILWSVASGIFIASGMWRIAIVTTAVMTATVILLDYLPIGSAPLILTVYGHPGDGEDIQKACRQIIESCCSKVRKISTGRTDGKQMLVLRVSTRQRLRLINEIAALPAVESVTLLEQSGEVSF